MNISTDIAARLGPGADLLGLLQGLFEHSPVPYAVFDREGRCRLTNPAYRQMFGREPPPEYSVLHDEVAAAMGIDGMLRDAFSGRTVRTPTFWYDPSQLQHIDVADAKRVAISCTVFPLLNADRTVTHVAIAYKDVTAELQAKAGAEQERDVMRAILEQSGDGIIVADAEGRVKVFNPAAEQQHGRRLQPVLAPDWGSAYGLYSREGAPLPLEETPLYRALRGERVQDAAWNVRRPDGQVRLLTGTATPLLAPDGTSVGAVVITRDETERTHAQERLRFLSDAGAALAASLDVAGTFERVAHLAVPFLADWCLVDAIEEAGGSRRIVVTHADPVDAPLAARLLHAHQSTAALAPEAQLLAQADAESLAQLFAGNDERAAVQDINPCSLMVVPLRARGRTLGRLILLTSRSLRRYTSLDAAVAEDLAGRAALAIDNARLYRESQQATARAESASRAKDDFMAMLGHELRNPLAPIKTALDVAEMRGGQISEPDRRLLGRQLDHLRRLVDDLLDVSRITTGKIELRKEPVTVAAVVQEAAELARAQLDDRRHRLVIDVAASAGSLVADRTRLVQVVVNLLNNAAKYTPPGGCVRITAVADDELGIDEGAVTLRVRDTGIGIAPEMINRVFEMFVQGRQDLDRSEGGLGLGLTIVRTLVRLHGGTIAVSSDGVGRGSEFVVTLPRGNLAEATAVAEPLRVTPASMFRASLVLIVDDNVDAADMLAQLIELQGHQVRVACDAATALTAALAEPPDVALVDIGLPGMNGYELAERMRHEPSLAQLRLIAVTGYGQPSDVARSRAAGFHDHLVKPVPFQAIERALRDR